MLGVGHQRRVPDHTEHPPVQPHHEVEDPARIARREEQRACAEEDEKYDQAGAAGRAPLVPIAERDTRSSCEDGDRKCRDLRTRRPTGLDTASLPRKQVNVKLQLRATGRSLAISTLLIADGV